MERQPCLGLSAPRTCLSAPLLPGEG
eukprot:COSAG06_NODE_42034_length_385_cov_0.958042_2_plen_25_part_01